MASRPQTKLDSIKERIEALSEEDRLELTVWLFHRIHDPEEPTSEEQQAIDQAWAEEIDRRLEEMKRGENCVDGKEVFREIAERRGLDFS